MGTEGGGCVSPANPFKEDNKEAGEQKQQKGMADLSDISGLSDRVLGLEHQVDRLQREVASVTAGSSHASLNSSPALLHALLATPPLSRLLGGGGGSHSGTPLSGPAMPLNLDPSPTVEELAATTPQMDEPAVLSLSAPPSSLRPGRRPPPPPPPPQPTLEPAETAAVAPLQQPQSQPQSQPQPQPQPPLRTNSVSPATSSRRSGTPDEGDFLLLASSENRTLLLQHGIAQLRGSYDSLKTDLAACQDELKLARLRLRTQQDLTLAREGTVEVLTTQLRDLAEGKGVSLPDLTAAFAGGGGMDAALASVTAERDALANEADVLRRRLREQQQRPQREAAAARAAAAATAAGSEEVAAKAHAENERLRQAVTQGQVLYAAQAERLAKLEGQVHAATTQLGRLKQQQQQGDSAAAAAAAVAAASGARPSPDRALVRDVLHEKNEAVAECARARAAASATVEELEAARREKAALVQACRAQEATAGQLRVQQERSLARVRELEQAAAAAAAASAATPPGRAAAGDDGRVRELERQVRDKARCVDECVRENNALAARNHALQGEASRLRERNSDLEADLTDKAVTLQMEKNQLNNAILVLEERLTRAASSSVASAPTASVDAAAPPPQPPTPPPHPSSSSPSTMPPDLRHDINRLLSTRGEVAAAGGVVPSSDPGVVDVAGLYDTICLLDRRNKDLEERVEAAGQRVAAAERKAAGGEGRAEDDEEEDEGERDNSLLVATPSPQRGGRRPRKQRQQQPLPYRGGKRQEVRVAQPRHGSRHRRTGSSASEEDAGGAGVTPTRVFLLQVANEGAIHDSGVQGEILKLAQQVQRLRSGSGTSDAASPPAARAVAAAGGGARGRLVAAAANGDVSAGESDNSDVFYSPPALDAQQQQQQQRRQQRRQQRHEARSQEAIQTEAGADVRSGSGAAGGAEAAADEESAGGAAERRVSGSRQSRENGQREQLMKKLTRIAADKIRGLEDEVAVLQRDARDRDAKLDLSEASAERYKASCRQLHTELRAGAQARVGLMQRLSMGTSAASSPGYYSTSSTAHPQH